MPHTTTDWKLEDDALELATQEEAEAVYTLAQTGATPEEARALVAVIQ